MPREIVSCASNICRALKANEMKIVFRYSFFRTFSHQDFDENFSFLFFSDVVFEEFRL